MDFHIDVLFVVAHLHPVTVHPRKAVDTGATLTTLTATQVSVIVLSCTQNYYYSLAEKVEEMF